MRTLSRRARRHALAVLGGAALVTATLVPSIATASSEPELVGAPVPYLIESAHAAGKVLEIGNQNAQSTVPGDSPAAAAVFPFAKTPEGLTAQTVLAYPVIGVDGAFVLANTEGEVLARRANDDEHYRYLEIPGMSLDEAAVDPFAQWTMTDAGDGTTYLRGVEPYANGTSAGLDMYNWKTDAGSEVQTYDAGTAAVQKWRTHRLIADVDPVEGRVDTGTAPELPGSLAGRYSWGLTASLATTWEAPDPSAWEVEGTVTVEGTATGVFGETVPVMAEYLVGSLGGAADVEMTGYVGMPVAQLRMLAPTTVERAISGSEATVTSPVTWDWSVLGADATASEGVIEVPATASTGFDARLLITIVPAEQVNILRGTGVNYAYTHMNGGTFRLTDGDRGTAGFDDWRSGGAANRVNPNTVSFYFDQPRQITGAAVYDVAGTQNIGGVTVQYRDLIGGWIDLPSADEAWPYLNPTPDLELVVDSDPTLATGIRVVITNKTSETWMSLSEIEAFGPELAR